MVLSPPPAWIQRAVPGPIVAWRTADVLGNKLVEGIAVSDVGGTLAVDVVDSRLDPPEDVESYDLPRGKFRALAVRRPAGRHYYDIVVTVGERVLTLRNDHGRLKLVASRKG